VSQATLEAAGSGNGWRGVAAYPDLKIRFRKASGRRCDRCWKVTPEADADGLCNRCRQALADLGPMPERLNA